MFRKEKSFKFGSSIGVINSKVISGQYKICPKCGRIYDKEQYNYCSMCETPEKLVPIKITL